jgi:hypothetical protein
MTLAKLSRAILRARLLDERTRRNIGAIKEALEKRRALTFGLMKINARRAFGANLN